MTLSNFETEYGTIDLLSSEGSEYGACRCREIPIMSNQNSIKLEYGAIDLLSPKGPEYGACRCREIPIMSNQNLILLIIFSQMF